LHSHGPTPGHWHWQGNLRQLQVAFKFGSRQHRSHGPSHVRAHPDACPFNVSLGPRRCPGPNTPPRFRVTAGTRIVTHRIEFRQPRWATDDRESPRNPTGSIQLRNPTGKCRMTGALTGRLCTGTQHAHSVGSLRDRRLRTVSPFQVESVKRTRHAPAAKY
jgi:hypothetical protein